jgi:LacI family transcriptional regulator
VTGRVTLRTVAERAGVHTSTASRALNPATRSVVNPATVSRVLQVAEALGYRPHAIARGLRTNRTMTVGMVVPDVEDPLFGPLIAGVEQQLGLAGYSLLVVSSRPRGAEGPPGSDILVRGRVDGMLVSTVPMDGGEWGEILASDIPMVQVNRRSELIDAPAVTGDDRGGIGQAVEYLVELGHTHIGHVAGPVEMSTGYGRRLGFEEATARLDVAHGPIEVGDRFRTESGYLAAARLLVDNPDLTAIVAANDLMALGVYRAAEEAGRRVGIDLAVTGYNDIAFMEFVQPPMTSVRVPYFDMGTRAAQALVQLMSDDGRPRYWVSLPTTLSIRESTMPV